jgi:hypothetical protein
VFKLVFYISSYSPSIRLTKTPYFFSFSKFSMICRFLLSTSSRSFFRSS